MIANEHLFPNLEVTVPSETITAMEALKKFQENPRVKNVRLITYADCCPVCASFEGTYEKEKAPSLPIEGCSHPNGCRCFYEPMLTIIYP